MASTKTAKTPAEKPENTNAFKHAVGPALVRKLAAELKRVHPSFDARGFLREVDAGLPALELKPRIRFVCDAMAKRLPAHYPDALAIVLATLGPALVAGEPVGSNAFYYWIHGNFVEHYGLAHSALSLRAMREITKRSTSEFAVRPYLAADLPGVLTFLTACARDPDPNVRRWVSEGTRPYLPWGKRVPALLVAPYAALPLLELLRADDSPYVRTSIANHLNDLTKLDPEGAVAIVRRWIADGLPHAPSIAKRALRGLVKAGHPGALAVFGVRGEARAKLTDLTLERAKIRVGDALSFAFTLTGVSKEELVIDYALTFPGAAQRRSRKVFKIAQKSVKKGESLRVQKRHSFRPITTRTYRAGAHLVEILVNGKVVARAEFLLVV